MLLPALAVLGCSLAPEYQRPASQLPEQFQAQDEVNTAAISNDWRQQFTDPGLQALIEQALEHNHDLRIAASRIEEARALYGIQRADRVPSLSADAAFNRGRSVVVPGESSQVGETYTAQLGVSAFELDFFGRITSLSQAALASYLATEEARDSARIGIIAEVANTWVSERSSSASRILAEQTLAAREESLAITELRYQRGLSTRIEQQTDISLTESARAELARLTLQHRQAQNALALLTGVAADALPLNEQPLAADAIAAVAAGVPSSLLERRPDIREAEQLLRAANANIGAARAAFFPSISLTGHYGYLSDEASSLFEQRTRQWMFTPQLRLPLFEGGRNRANLDLAHARNNIAVTRYEQVVQQAFRDVADALAATEQLQLQQQALQRVADADDERAQLARYRYERGVAGYLEVLEAERSRFASAQQLLSINQAVLGNRVALYRALGGSSDNAGSSVQ